MKTGVFDLDGTLSSDSWRRPMIDRSRPNPWEEYHSHCSMDKPMNLHLLSIYDRIIFLTARPDRYQEATVEWLKENLGSRYDSSHMSLYMRPEGDKRSSPELKVEMLKEAGLIPLEIDGAYDDRQDVIAAYKEWGIQNAVLVSPPETPGDILDKMAATFKDRSRVYGKNYLHFGDVCAAMWPDGLTLKTKEDWVRLGVLVQIISKLTRYTQSPTGHKDSAHDIGPYAAILESVTQGE